MRVGAMKMPEKKTMKNQRGDSFCANCRNRRLLHERLEIAVITVFELSQLWVTTVTTDLRLMAKPLRVTMLVQIL